MFRKYTLQFMARDNKCIIKKTNAQNFSLQSRTAGANTEEGKRLLYGGPTAVPDDASRDCFKRSVC